MNLPTQAAIMSYVLLTTLWILEAAIFEEAPQNVGDWWNSWMLRSMTNTSVVGLLYLETNYESFRNVNMLLWSTQSFYC